MMSLVDISIRRAVFAVMLIASLVGLGFMSMGRLGVDLFPDVEFPYVNVTATLDGASAETMESEVTDILEEYINTIDGIETLQSFSSEGRAQILIEFNLSSNAREKVQDVRDKVQVALAELPPDMDPPIVDKVDPDAAPIISVMIAGDLPIAELTAFADDVAKERLQRLDGVGAVKLVGVVSARCASGSTMNGCGRLASRRMMYDGRSRASMQSFLAGGWKRLPARWSLVSKLSLKLPVRMAFLTCQSPIGKMASQSEFLMLPAWRTAWRMSAQRHS